MKTIRIIHSILIVIYALGLSYFLFFPGHYLRDLLINFVPYILLLHIPFFLIFLPFHSRKSVRYFLFGLIISMIMQSISLVSPYIHSKATFAASGKRTSLKVISANILKTNRDYGATISMIEEENPDVFALLELTQDFADGIKSLHEKYPYRLTVPYANGFGIGLYSKAELFDVKARDFPGSIPFIETKVKKDGRLIRIIALHLMAPFTEKMFGERNESLHLLARHLNMNDPEIPSIVMGDFNLTPWSSFYRTFEKESGLVNSRSVERGLQTSWYGMGFYLPIDHVFTSKNISVKNLNIGSDIHSDHWPLIAKVSY